MIVQPNLYCIAIVLTMIGCANETDLEISSPRSERKVTTDESLHTAMPDSPRISTPNATTAKATDLTSTLMTRRKVSQPVDLSATTTPIQVAQAISVWEGVYTTQQRDRGKEAYMSSCVRCHGEVLNGNEAVPALVGPEFLQRWERKRAGNLFSYMKTEMPPKKKLASSQYADILAFLLAENDAPAGEAELADDFMTLQSILMNQAIKPVK